jgi:hypothetical protein
LIELLAEGGRQSSDFAFSYHPGRSIPFKAGDVKGLNAPNARKRGKNRLGQRGGRQVDLNHESTKFRDWKLGFGMAAKDHGATEQRTMELNHGWITRMGKDSEGAT